MLWLDNNVAKLTMLYQQNNLASCTTLNSQSITVSEQFLNGTSAQNRPFQCQSITVNSSQEIFILENIPKTAVHNR